MIKMIHRMQHHICTVFGNLHQATGRNTWNTPIAGIRQGNGVGPPILAVVSSPMFNIMRQDGFYVLLIGAISQQQRKISGFAFMDDMDLCMTHPSEEVHQVVQQMKQAVNHWEGLLWASGGTLVPKKCFWYLIDFEYANNKWHYKNVANPQEQSPCKIVHAN